MLLKRLQVLTQIVGSMTLILLALYGLLALVEGNATSSWAEQQIAKVTGGTQNAPIHQWGDSTVPLVINYNGNADDHEGNPLTGYYTVTIAIYDNVIATSPLWSEEHHNVTVSKGDFSVLLGNNTPLTNTLFTHPDRFIGVTVHPYDEMVPRQRFASIPYAMHSYHATEADNALALPSPDFESDWFLMESQQGANSYKEIDHNLGEYPSRVKVLVKAIDGANEGFIFEGSGTAQADDDVQYRDYGGVIFAYNQTQVRLWAPDKNNSNTTGSIIHIADGWGGEINIQASHKAEVKVLVWR